MKRRPGSGSVQFVIFILLSLALAGCGVRWTGTPAVQGSGKKASEARKTGEFTKISLQCAADVDVKIGDKTSLVVEGDDNLLPLITTEVKNGVLTISTDESYRTQLGIRVHVITPKLELAEVAGSGRISTAKIEAKQFEASVSGSGEIDIDGLTADKVVASVPGSGRLTIEELKADSLKGSVDGSGSITADGSVQTLDISAAGSGSLNLEDLAARNASVSIAGSGGANVHVSGKLDASITGSGSVTYTGDPEMVEKGVTGSGSIRAR